jgi:signal transduction histidine kinase
MRIDEMKSNGGGMVGLERFIPSTRRAFGQGVAVALAVLAATILAGLLPMRAMVREQIARRDAEALYATTLMEQLDTLETDGSDVRTDEEVGFDAAIRASRLKGVLGIRFFDVDGGFSDTFPASVMPQPLDAEPLADVRDLTAHGCFRPDTPLSDVFIYLPQFSEGRIAQVPILEVTVPLHRRDAATLVGSAQFIVEGTGIAAEYARLNRQLIRIGLFTFAVAGSVLVAMLWPAFRRMEKLNLDLSARGERLQRANDELALAARASAVGAISAHLMHGLKNPLASLSQFVSRGPQADDPEQADWQDALSASRRMQSLVEQTLEVIGDVRGNPAYEVTVKELLSDVQGRIAAAASRRSVVLSLHAEGNCTLSSRAANLTGLILVNLLENAIEASPAGASVRLGVSKQGERLCFLVRDEGTGFPEHLRNQLFLPCKSTREGGSGIGLAISKQLAECQGATLELADSSPQGCVFRLMLPLSACQEPAA